MDDGETLPARHKASLRTICNATVINAGIVGTTLITHPAMVQRALPPRARPRVAHLLGEQHSQSRDSLAATAQHSELEGSPDSPQDATAIEAAERKKSETKRELRSECARRLSELDRSLAAAARESVRRR